jgi:hypothetical protein
VGVTTRHWLAGTVLAAAAFIVVTGIAAGQAAPVSRAHQASYVHHQVHRTAGELRLTHFMPDTPTHFMPDTQPSVLLVLLIHREDRSPAGVTWE